MPDMPDRPVVDPLVIGVLVAGVLIALLAVFGSAAYKSDGLTLSPSQPPTESPAPIGP